MAIKNERIFGLAVPLSLADIPDREEALLNISLDIRDIDIIREVSLTGFDTLDLQTLSNLNVPIWRTFDRYITDVLTYNGQLSSSAGVDFRTRGNLEVLGPLSSTAFRYSLLESSGQTPILRWGDISTSRVSSWSSINDAIVYGADVSINGKLSIGSLRTRPIPQQRTFSSETPTHKIKLRINGVEQFLLVMKGIPIRFKGFFRDFSSSVGYSGGAPVSWRVYNTDGSGQIQDFPNIISSSSSSNFNYGSPFSSSKTIEIYKNPLEITTLSLSNCSIQELPKSRLINLSSLTFESNGLIECPNFVFFTPAVQTLRIQNNPFFNSNDAKKRYFSEEVSRNFPSTIRTLNIIGCFKAGFEQHTLRNLGSLTTLSASRSLFNGAYFYPDSVNPNGELPTFYGISGNSGSHSIATIDFTNNDFRTIPAGRQGGIDRNPFDPPSGQTFPPKGYKTNFSGNGGAQSFVNGTYQNVPVVNITGSGEGATADITVSNGFISFIQIKDPGKSYQVGDTFTVSTTTLGNPTAQQPVFEVLRVFNTLSIEELTSIVSLGLTSNTSLGSTKKFFTLNCGNNITTVSTSYTALPIANCSNFTSLQSYSHTFGSNRRSVHSQWNGYIGRGSVTEIEVSNQGTSGYVNGNVTITGGDGSGLILNITTSAGKVISATIVDGGEDYKRDLTGTIAIPGGSGDARIKILDNTYPRSDLENFKFANCAALTAHNSSYSDIRGYLPRYFGCPALTAYDYYATNNIVSGRPGKRKIVKLFDSGGILEPLGGYIIENQNGSSSPGYTPGTYSVQDDGTLSNPIQPAVVQVVVGSNGFPSSYTIVSSGSGYTTSDQLHFGAVNFNPPNTNNLNKNLVINITSVVSGAIAPNNGDFVPSSTFSLTDTGKGSFCGINAQVQIVTDSSGFISTYSLTSPGIDYVNNEFVVVNVPLELGGTGEVQLKIQEAEPAKILYNDQFSTNTNITSVDININNVNFKGEIEPDAFAPLKDKMSFLRLESNGRITGSFPNIEDNTALRTVYSAGQGWSGPLPSFSQATALSNLRISDNKFSGPFNLTDKPELYYVDISNNKLTSIEDGIILSNLEYLYLSNNLFGRNPTTGLDDSTTGIFPNLSDSTPNVKYVQLNNNNFTNYISGCFKKLYKVISFDISNNKLSESAIDQILFDFVDNYSASPRGGVLLNLQGSNMSRPSQFPPINGTLLDVDDPPDPTVSNGNITSLGGKITGTAINASLIPVKKNYVGVATTSSGSGFGATFTIDVDVNSVKNVVDSVNSVASPSSLPGVIQSIPGTFSWSAGSNSIPLTPGNYTLTHDSTNAGSNSANGTGASISFTIEADGIPQGTVGIVSSGDDGTNNMATGYVAGAIYSVTGTGTGLRIRVLTVNVRGGVATAEIVSGFAGSGYGIPSGSETVTLGAPITGGVSSPSSNATVSFNVRRNFNPINLALVQGGDGFTKQSNVDKVVLNMNAAGTGAQSGNYLLVNLGNVREYTNGTATYTTTSATGSGAEISVTVTNGGFGGGIIGTVVNKPDNGGYSLNQLLTVTLPALGTASTLTATFTVSAIKADYYRAGDLNYTVTQINTVGEGYANLDVITTSNTIEFVNQSGNTVFQSLEFRVSSIQQLINKSVKRGQGAVEFLRSKGWTVQVTT
jgi:hypothetical protein